MADKIFTSPLIPSSRQLVSRDRATMTGVLSAVAGAPCGVQTRRGREGSFLVLVVGTLALLAVITIVYVALGNADTRTKAASQSRVQQDDVAPKVADWIATTIANDALATEFTGEVESLVATNGQADGPGRLRRETSDAPGVRPNISSAPGAPVNQQFDPTGTVNAGVRELIRINTNADDRNFIVPASDPFLASMVPVNFKYQFATGDGGANELPDPSRPYLYDLDWLSISNFAPDGAFVNLDNLRGNWGASSLALRQNKTLYDVNGLPTDRLVFGDRGQQGEVADQNNPAHWTMYQQRAFQPGTLTSQWADADGDGMLDSRIFEMIDGQAGDGRRLTPSINAPGVRYFIAARAIDLSGMVNLTTASDFTTGANNMFVAGATPADVDLKRLLTQIDMYADQNPFGQTNVLAGYQSIVQSADPANLDGAATPDSPQNYGDYTESAAFRAGSSAYAALRLSLAASTPIGRDILDNNQAFSLAETDYQIPVQDTQLGIFAASLKNLNPSNLAELKRLQTLFGAPYPATGDLPTALTTTDWAAQRSLAWNEAVKRFQGGSYASSQGLGTLPGGLFTTADLGELLTRFGINSDERSAIEVVIGGRDATNGPLSTRFDPLRSNRPESVELIRFEVDPTTGIDMTPPVGGLQDRVMRLFGSDIRRFITPLNGARQLRSQTVTSNASTLDGSELKINLRAVLDEVAGRERGNLAKLYAGYAAGLAPFAHLESAWSPQQFGTQPLPSRTLFYGYRGPEAALLAAAHMAVNLKDFADADTRPSAATVVMSRDAVDTLSNASGTSNDVVEPLHNYSPWFLGIDALNVRERNDDATPRQFVVRDENGDPNLDVLAAGNNDTVAPAVNVYGVEPQIFITQVSTMTMYVDDAQPPSSEELDDPVLIDIEFPPSRRDSRDPVDSRLDNVIDSAKIQDADNSEVAARIIAFKVVNPFDRPVRLSDAVFSDGELDRPASNFMSASDSWVGGLFMDVSELDRLAADTDGAVRPDSLRDYQYIRVGEGEGARYYLLMAMQQQVNGAGFVPGPTLPSGTPGTYAAPPAALASREAPVITLEPITLAAGETAILYAISEPPARIAERLDGRGEFPNQDVAQRVERFFTNQLADGANTTFMRRFWIPLYAPTLPSGENDAAVEFAGTGLTAAGLQNVDDFVDVIPADNTTEPRSITLWRSDRRLNRERATVNVNWSPYRNWATQVVDRNYGQLPLGLTWTPPANVYQPNDVRNDIMLDRFKVPWGAKIDSKLFLASGVGDEVTMEGQERGNTPDGLTVITARTMRRPADPGNDFAGGLKPFGVLPMYCIEPKYVDADIASDNAWNVADESVILDEWDENRPQISESGAAYDGDASTPPDDDLIIGGAFRSIENAVEATTNTVGVGADPANANWQMIDDMARAPQVWKLGASNAGGRVFASTFGAGPQQATGVDGQLYKFYNEMYPSLLASGADRASDPTDPQSPLIRTNMFRVQSFDRTLPPNTPPAVLGSAKQILITLPDGTVIPQPDRNVPTEPDFTSNISTLRLTDLLLPLGLGPMEVPAGNVNGNWPSSNVYNPNDFVEARTRYTTLGEAVAIAMGFEVTGAALPADAYAQDPALWWAPREAGGEYRLPVPVRPISTEPLRADASDVLMFDNGNLALDRFVPFVDLDGDGIPNAGTTFEPTWGLGITPAANVLEQFTIIEAPTGLSNRPLNNGSVAQRDYDARRNNELLTTAVPGLVNINTAPVQVLRTLPFVSPAPSLKAGVDQTDLVGATLNITNADRRSFENGTNSFDHSPFLDFRINAAPAPAPSVLDQAADIAPTLAAYRDLYPERFRRDTMVFMANRLTQLGLNNAVRNRLVDPDPDAPLDPLTFSGADGLANRISPMLWTWIDGQQASDWLPRLWSAENKTRERATGVPGVRSQPGFRSPGELIFARALWFEAASNESIGVAPLGAQAGAFRQQIVRGLPTNPDFLGYDQYLAPGGTPANRGLPAAFRGLDPVQGHTSDAQTTAAVANDVRSPNNIALLNVRNTMSEKLLVPGAMISSTTTRSDVYAVWFTIFGFREGDVGPAGSTEPLQPSVQRRFLMVVDRSNVTQLGQKPRIVLFKEVPM
ncbi:MAG TPA: hypothetical protein VK157_12370 [Phycisphaerales bacterium]|nr:hypothetical protein [Phycisphaerales bacterium]